MLKLNDKVAIVCCSNPQPLANKEKINELIGKLKSLDLNPILSKYIFEDNYGNGEERGKALMEFYLDKEIKAIFDISGGDIANDVLEYLDYNVIMNNKKAFFGYSDLTTVINAIYSKTENLCYLYQVRNIISKDSEEQIHNFTKTLLENEKDLFDIDYRFLKGNSMSGVVVGGNIRCLLKLAGTDYMPNFNNKILLLEGMSGKVPQMTTYLTQLKQIGAFKHINGIILGTFTEMEKEKCEPKIEDLVKMIVNSDIPIIKTMDIGHGSNSKCIIIGKHYNFE